MRSRYCTIALLSLISAASRLCAAQDELIRRWEFKTPADAAGWTIGHEVKDLQVAGGRLLLTTTGPDAYIFAPAVDTPLDGCMVRIRMGSDGQGVSEVFWTTGDAPDYSQQRHAWREKPMPVLAGSQPSDVATYDFIIGNPTDKDRQLTGFRIDPFNGQGGVRVQIAAVELWRLRPVLDASVSTRAHLLEANTDTDFTIDLHQIAGRAIKDQVVVTLPDGTRLQTPIGKLAHAVVTHVRAGQPGVNRFAAKAGFEIDGPAYELETSVLVGTPDTLPVATSMRSDQVRLDFIASADGSGVGGARWLVATGPDQWRLAGWLLPLARVVYQGDDGRIICRQPSLKITKNFTDAVRLEGFLDDESRLRATIMFTLRTAGRPHQIAMTCSLEATGPARLLDFSGPTLLADRDAPGDPLNRLALFGGLEFLEPGWASSSERAVGERFAKRWSPFPYKITLPIMAVEDRGLTTAMMWKPAPAGEVTDPGPWATFASPNFLGGQANHLMRLSLPTPAALRSENESYARQPILITPAGFSRLWQCVLHAEPDLPVTMMARRWYETFNPPSPASRPHDDAGTYDLIARNFGETMWWPEERGWRHHWYHSETRSSYVSDMAAELIAHSITTGRSKWIEQTGLQGKQIIDAAGTLENRLAGEGHAKATLASMRPDGTWAFQNTPEMRAQTRQLTDGKYDSLGDDGSTSLGTCVQSALPVLRYAEISGEAPYIEAGVKALEAMRQFRVPRGAQVWEVHQQIPDIRAAALAVEAYQVGYRVTGNKRFLEDANYWAWAGVPFIYSWHVPTDSMAGAMVASRDKHDSNRIPLTMGEGFENPRRQIMPYATVPVLGPTFYVVNWFGVVVQWCGLEWAQHVIELDADRPDPLLRQVADGVVASGLQQMFDQPPWTGLYPDVWDVESNTAQGALIYAGLPLRCLIAEGRVPAWTSSWTRVVRSEDGKTRWHVSGWGQAPPLPAAHAGRWSATLTYPAGQAYELVLAGVNTPKQVLLEDDELAANAAGSEGWHYLPEKRALIIRFKMPTSGRASIHLIQ